MTICNINLTSDHVWMVADSVQFRIDGTPRSFATKFSTFPHLLAICGFRGLAALHHKVDVFVNGGGRVCDVEEAAERLPAELRRWQAELRDQYPDHHASIVGELFLLGWRPSQKAFGGWRFGSDQDFVAVELDVPGTYLNPANEQAPPPAVLSSPDILIKVGELQRQMSAVNVQHGAGDLGIGGELIMCQLSRKGFSIRKPHRFDDYAQVKELLRNGR